MTIKADMHLHILQFNAGSIHKNLVKTKSQIFEELLDLVLLYEDWILLMSVPFLIPGYTWLHCLCSQARQVDGVIHSGGGVSILVRSNNNHIAFKYATLPNINLLPDSVTELIQVRLYWTHPGSCTILDVINIY
jgi:hypothetical protein